MTKRMYQNHQGYDVAKTRNADLMEDLFEWLLDWEQGQRGYRSNREHMRHGVTVFNGDNNASFFMDDALDRFEEWKEEKG